LRVNFSLSGNTTI